MVSNIRINHSDFSPPLVVQYDRLQKLNRDFQPFRDLWTATSDWLRWHESWMTDPLSIIDPEQLERNVNDAFKTMHKCVKQFKDIPGGCHLAKAFCVMLICSLSMVHICKNLNEQKGNEQNLLS